ncbi:AAA family ATPase [Zoogloea sp.]|uniref:AAA family ATPase n=1 Tax=Zoogloea sp. TaxID=49181 RepID=UPI0035B2F66E
MPAEPSPTLTRSPEIPLSSTVKYNPHLWGDDELRAIFVVRKPELERLVDAVRASRADSVPQHILITGHRGMGKSTLLRRVALAVRDDPELSQGWLALSFPEEQYTVSTLTEFWRNVLDSLTDALEQRGASPAELARLDAAIASIDSLVVDAREDAALKLLTDWIARHQQRVLLLIDSTDLLLAGLAGGGNLRSDRKGVSIRDAGATPLWRLRKTLSHEKGIFWLGASYQALEAQHQYQDAFHDFFQLVELRPLSVAHMREAMLALAGSFGMKGLHGDAATAEMARALDARPERLKALRAMTGGNPRTTVMLYDLFAVAGDGNVHSDLRGLLDIMTPLYKARMESLAEQPRKLLAHLMEHWAPATARILADTANLPVTTVSGQLSRLETEGLIEKVRHAGAARNAYQIAERFFNVWYLMRYSSRRLRQRLTWLVEFMRLWFSADELVVQARGRCEYLGGGRGDQGSLEYARALAFALPEGHQDRYRLEWSVFSAARKIGGDTREAIRELFEIDGDEKEFVTAEDYLARFNALDAGLRKCPHVPVDEMDGWIAAVKGALSLSLEIKERIAGDAASLTTDQYGMIRSALIDEEDWFARLGSSGAMNTLRVATVRGDFFPDCPDSRLAQRQIFACFGDDAASCKLAANLLMESHHDVCVEIVLRKAIELDHANPELWHRMGYLLQEYLRRPPEAEDAYRKAIALNGKNALAWNSLGTLLQDHFKRYSEAESAYRKSINLNEKFAAPWNNLGNLLQLHLQRYSEAEAAFRKAIELDPEDALPWNNLGSLLQDHLQRDIEAEEAYRNAIRLDGHFSWPWNNLGKLLHHRHKQYPEAEAAYRKAIDLDAKYARPWVGLGDLLQDCLGRQAEAEAAYRRASCLDPDDPYSVTNLARLLAVSGRVEEATVAYGDALKRLARSKREACFEVTLQAHLWLGNQDKARVALEGLAAPANNGGRFQFDLLVEQVAECNKVGLGLKLANLMEESPYADFLKPLSLTLRVAAGADDGVLASAPPEIATMAEAVLAKVRTYRLAH